uniref:Uncharacterized protein n=1 Tax=Oryza glaberrima TaxID=4538 RepID=I1P0C6_ORYGL
MAMVRWRPVGLEVERCGGARGEASVEDTMDWVEEERDVQRILAISEIYNGDACMTITGEMNQELIYNFSGLYATAQRKAPARRRRRNHAPRPLLVATPLEEERRARKVKTEREQGKGSFVFLELKDGTVFVRGAGVVEAKKGGAAGGGDDGRHHHRHNQAVQSAVARERPRRISNGRAVAMAGKRRQRRTVSHATHLLLLSSPNSHADVGLLLPAAVLRLLLCPCPLESAASTHELATTERAKATALPALTASSSPALARPPPAPVPRPPLAERKRMREGGG